jgi:hypothetical protein
MIARIWHSKTAVAKADAYMQYFHKTGLADYQATGGNKEGEQQHEPQL